jgi:hypothetical protein
MEKTLTTVIALRFIPAFVVFRNLTIAALFGNNSGII